jgi:hypothetical protein
MTALGYAMPSTGGLGLAVESVDHEARSTANATIIERLTD